ncbi:MAG: hypothetical protein AB7G75_33710 [Candidatus Binatia bacterium]
MTTIALDFDGVLSLYTGDAAQPPGPPVPQAREFVHILMNRGLEVVIFSSWEQETIAGWLQAPGFPPLPIFYKPPVLARIDDRAVRFPGTFDGVSRAIWKPPWWQASERSEQQQ